MEEPVEQLESGPQLDRLRQPPAARRRAIIRYLEGAGSATVSGIAEKFGISLPTVHRDLELLERDGLVDRVRGGAELRTSSASTAPGGRFNPVWSDRLHARAGAKAVIGRLARATIEPHSTIFLDGSTTALAVAAALEVDPLPVTIVTDSPAAAFAVQAPSIDVVMAPGHVDPELRMLTGQWTTDFLAEPNYTAAFVSGAAIDLRTGLTTTRREILDVLRTVMGRADRTYCLVDSSKFDRSAMLSVAQAQEFDAVFTDDELAESTASAFVDAGVRLRRATRREREEAVEAVGRSRTWALTFGTVPD